VPDIPLAQEGGRGRLSASGPLRVEEEAGSMSNRRKVPRAPTADGPAVPVAALNDGMDEARAEAGLSPDEVTRLKWMRISEFLDILDDDTPA
jgi:hypothetical protein